MTESELVSFDFEIFGIVQDVFFRKFTKKNAKSLGLVGWVRNTEQGTVTGIAQGPQDKVKVMKDWLEKEGSPESRVDRAEFKNERTISKLEFESFTVPDPDY